MFNLDTNKRDLLRWCKYFLVCNIMLFWLIGITYTRTIIWQDASYLPLTNKIVLSLLVAISYLGQLTLTATVPCVLIAAFILCYPKRHLIFLMAPIITTIYIAMLLGNELIYSLFHIHLQQIILNMLLALMHKKTVTIPILDYAVCLSTGIVLLLLEALITYLLWDHVIKKHKAFSLTKCISSLTAMLKISGVKRDLIDWCWLFFIVNIFMFWLLGTRYIQATAWIDTEYLAGITRYGKHVLTTFFAISYLGQLAILAFLPAFIISLLTCICPKKYFIITISVLTAIIAACMLRADAILYGLFHYHLNGIILNLLLHSASEQFFALSRYEYTINVCVIVGITLIEIAAAAFIWRQVTIKKNLLIYANWILVLASIFFYTSYTMLAFSVEQPWGPQFIETSRALPLYTEFLSALLPIKHSQLALERHFEEGMVQPAQVSPPLHYPLHTLEFSSIKKPLNVVIIGIDAWRFDMLNAEVTPNIYEFAQQSWQFTQHFSGGNATGPGVFSLFYGLPSTYWTAMELQHHSPVLLDEFQRRHYKVKILASGGLTLPAFNRTVFQAFDHLQTELPGNNPYERDVLVTHEFKKFLDQTSSQRQPFFSFLFYDSSHSYCAIKNNLTPFKTAGSCDRANLENHSNRIPYFNRYRNALHLVDEQVGQVIYQLKAHHLLANTVIIITGDHGEEFNDNHLGYWGHASNFTHYQLQTPLIIHWPGERSKIFSHLTTHYDIAPTLMMKLFGCKTPSDDYSMGRSLFAVQLRPYRIATSYIGFGVIEKNRITTVFPLGMFQVTQLNAEPLLDANVDATIMHAVFKDLRRFYF